MRSEQSSVGRWFFDKASLGSFEGFNNPGEEFFKDDYWDKTIRELLQNSLDAAISENTVHVTIKLRGIAVSEINPQNLAPHFESAKYMERNNTKAQKHFGAALKLLNTETIEMLEVSDSNTTGLKDREWETLVFKPHSTYKKNKASGGSFGIGKDAPFHASKLKTIFYYTTYPMDGHNVEKFIGKCRLVTHIDPSDDDNQLDHFGFFTKNENNNPSKNELPIEGDGIPEAFRTRNQSGSTVVFIIGPKLPRNWQMKTAESVAHNFFMAVMDRKLEVRISNEDGDEMLVNAETLGKIFQSGKQTKFQAYYEIAKSGKSRRIEGDFGKFELKFSLDGNNLPKRVAYMNRRGMFITDGKQFNTNPFSPPDIYSPYGAVIQAADDDTDAMIRKMEPPSHDKISCERIDDDAQKTETKNQLKVIQDQIGKIIIEAIGALPSTSVNVDELAPLLPMVKNRTYSLTKKPLNFGPRGADTDITLGDGDLPGTPPGPPPGPPGPPSGPTRSSGSGGRKKSSILNNANVKRHGSTLRVWLTLNRDINSLKFFVFPAGEQLVNGEDCLVPQSARAVGNHTLEKILVDGSMVTIQSPPKNIVVDLEMRNLREYSGYVVRAVKESPQKSGPAEVVAN